jgi:hypothetical protein
MTDEDRILWGGKVPEIPWPGPTEAMLAGDPLFEAIWQAIRTWDINVPEVYNGYTGSMGNHARAIYDSIQTAMQAEVDRVEAGIAGRAED